MARIIEKESRPQEIVPIDFWQGKKTCWEMCHCPEVIKNECPAPRHPSFPCWEIEGTYCKLNPSGNDGRDITICKICRVYKRWGENKPIQINLFGQGINAFRKFLDQKAGELTLPEKALASAQFTQNNLVRRNEMYSPIAGVKKVDEIIDKYNCDQGALNKIVKDIQEELEWLPREAIDHVGERLQVNTTKIYRMAIFGKNLSIIPKVQQVDGNICIIDLLKQYLDFLQHDLCGKCIPCREGMHQMYKIVSAMSRGEAKESDFALLKELAGWVVELSACNQGSIAANIVLKAIEDFEYQFKEHVDDKRCHAGICEFVAAKN